MTKTLATLAAVMFSSIAAHAATVEYSFSLPPSQAPTEISQTGNLSFFNPAFGVLTGASLQLTGAATFTFQATNNAAQAQSAQLISFTELSWSSSLGALTPFLLDNMTLAGDSGLQSYNVGQSRLFGPFSSSDVFTDNLGGILASLQGPGSFSLTCDSTSGVQVLGGGGNFFTTQSTTAGCGAKIVYTYDSNDVPEPTSLALAGLALAAAGLTSRRRKA